MDVYLLNTLLPLIAGWVLDKLLGDPAWLPHPVVGFGKLISWFERRWNRGKQRKTKGAVADCPVIAGTIFCGEGPAQGRFASGRRGGGFAFGVGVFCWCGESWFLPWVCFIAWRERRWQTKCGWCL